MNTFVNVFIFTQKEIIVILVEETVYEMSNRHSLKFTFRSYLVINFIFKTRLYILRYLHIYLPLLHYLHVTLPLQN